MSITKASLIDLNGQELILDADADTSITADTDDQIDIKIAGSDVITLTSSALTSSAGNTMFGGSGFDNGNLSGSAGGVNVFDATHPIVLLKETTGNTTFYMGKSTSSNFIATEDAQPIAIATTDTQRVLIEAGGNVTINEPSNDCDFRVESNNKANMFLVDAGADAVLIGGGASENFLSESHELQVNDTNFSVASFATYRAGSDGATLSIGHSRNGTINSHTVLNDDDTMGLIQFYGSDGTDFARGASIQAAVDGTPGNNDMPGRLVFSTTADGSDSPTERVRINSSGQVGIGTDNPTRLLHMKQDDTTTYAGNSAGTNIALHLANTSSGAAGNTIGIGMSSESNAEVYLNCVTSANNNGGDFVIASRYGGRSEKMRVRGAGGITFNGDTGDANALDDYEEGTWTCTFGTSGGSFSSSLSSNQQTGYYTKVGNHVVAYVYAVFNITAGGSGIAKISGLPFTSKNVSAYGFAAFYHTTAFTTATTTMGYVATNESFVYPVKQNTSDGDTWSVGNTRYVMMYVSYFTD